MDIRPSIFISTLLFSLLITGCASIVSKSSYPITISSNPTEANVTVTNSDGNVVYTGKTPVATSLKANKGFFKRENYEVRFSKEGYDDTTVPLRTKVDGWYWGNIVFGGIIGLFIVDPATGAMYKFEDHFLTTDLGQSKARRGELKIYPLDDVPVEWKSHLVLLIPPRSAPYLE